MEILIFSSYLKSTCSLTLIEVRRETHEKAMSFSALSE